MNKKEDNVKERLLDVSINLFLSKGFAGATTMEIARLAGVSKGALYWHFKNKEDIVGSILDKYCDEFLEEAIRKINNCSGNFPTKFRVFYKFITEFAQQHKELLLVFTTVLMEFADTRKAIGKRTKRINDQYNLIIQKLIEGGIQEGTVGKELDPLIYARFIAGTLMGSHLQWYLHEDNSSIEKRLAITQRDALLKVVLSGASSLPFGSLTVGRRSGRSKKP
jgi:AcrR family transcriptional regulator